MTDISDEHAEVDPTRFDVSEDYAKISSERFRELGNALSTVPNGTGWARSLKRHLPTQQLWKEFLERMHVYLRSLPKDSANQICSRATGEGKAGPSTTHSIPTFLPSEEYAVQEVMRLAFAYSPPEEVPGVEDVEEYASLTVATFEAVRDRFASLTPPFTDDDDDDDTIDDMFAGLFPNDRLRDEFIYLLEDEGSESGIVQPDAAPPVTYLPGEILAMDEFSRICNLRYGSTSPSPSETSTSSGQGDDTGSELLPQTFPAGRSRPQGNLNDDEPPPPYTRFSTTEEMPKGSRLDRLLAICGLALRRD